MVLHFASLPLPHLACASASFESYKKCTYTPLLDLSATFCPCSKSICYADLKPANIMFSEGSECPTSPRAQHAPQLQVRAVDFGCSRVAAKGRPLTQCCGSPLYMAPEMALQRFGVGVDMWAAGVMVSGLRRRLLQCFVLLALSVCCALLAGYTCMQGWLFSLQL
jgi:serine/threonine protein kinase